MRASRTAAAHSQCPCRAGAHRLPISEGGLACPWVPYMPTTGGRGYYLAVRELQPSLPGGSMATATGHQSWLSQGCPTVRGGDAQHPPRVSLALKGEREVFPSDTRSLRAVLETRDPEGTTTSSSPAHFTLTHGAHTHARTHTHTHVCARTHTHTHVCPIPLQGLNTEKTVSSREAVKGSFILIIKTAATYSQAVRNAT